MQYEYGSLASIGESSAKKIYEDKYVPKDYILQITIHECKSLSHLEEENLSAYVKVEVINRKTTSLSL